MKKTSLFLILVLLGVQAIQISAVQRVERQTLVSTAADEEESSEISLNFTQTTIILVEESSEEGSENSTVISTLPYTEKQIVISSQETVEIGELNQTAYEEITEEYETAEAKLKNLTAGTTGKEEVTEGTPEEESSEGTADVFVSSSLPGSPPPVNIPPTLPEDDNSQCVFPVIVDTDSPNCTNIDSLINITNTQIGILLQAKTVTQNELIALQETYNFIVATCEDGVYGVPNIKPVPQASLLQVGERVSRYDPKFRSVLPATDLIERRAMKAFMSATELLEDAPHCTQQEIDDQCNNYLNETNATIAAIQEFLNEINEKSIYLSERWTFLTIWKTTNLKNCICSNSSTYSNSYCCDTSPWNGQQDCICAKPSTWSEGECCNLTAYNTSKLCKCYEQFDSSCCDIPKYSSNQTCFCQKNNTFTIKGCCNLTGYKDVDPRCICNKTFTTGECCGISPYKDQLECTCLTNFNVKSCCDVYPNDTRCICENPGHWDTKYCCGIKKYQGDPKCTCVSNFTTNPCCGYPDWQDTLSCNCSRCFDPLTCCSLTEHQNDTECQCQNNFNATTCCGLQQYKNRAECVCLRESDSIFFPTSCCNYSEFESKHACQCLKQDLPESPLQCCDQPKFINLHECVCLRQCDALSPVPCCDYPGYANTTECLCAAQKTPFDSSLPCCNYAPFLGNKTWQHECQCRASLDGKDHSKTPATGCCDTSTWKNTTFCQCENGNFTTACCAYPDFANWTDCLCQNQTTDPLSPNACCNQTIWKNDLTCLCQNQTTDPLYPNNCCDQPFWTNQNNQDCICSTQTDPISGDSDCCYLSKNVNKTQCLCRHNQTEPTSPNNCCGETRFNTTLECNCSAQNAPYVEGGFNCCSIPSWNNSKECQCNYNWDPCTCCQYGEFQDRHDCQCQKYMTEQPFNATLNCCDQPNWQGNHQCNCISQNPANGGNPLSPSWCCDIYSTDINCICQNQTLALGDHDCCNATRFDGDKSCQCKPQVDSNSSAVYPYDCCDQPSFKDNLDCTCRGVSVPYTPSLNCCQLSNFSDYEQCECFVNFDEDKCCKYDPFKSDRHECICQAQTTSSSTPEACCDTKSWKDKPDCVCPNQTASPFTPVPCCDYAPWQGTHDCLCQSQNSPITPSLTAPSLNCCNVTSLSNLVSSTDCSCYSQVDALSPNDCCYHPEHENDLECICKNQPLPIFVDSHNVQQNCCSLSNYTTHPQCLCEANFDAVTCCIFDQWKNLTDCLCYAEYLSENSGNKTGTVVPVSECCGLANFSTRTECVCNNATTFTKEQCCAHPDITTTPHPECVCYNQTNATSPTNCCGDDKFSGTHQCICQNLKGSPVDTQTDGKNCCDIYTTDADCVCATQQTGIVGDSNCCNYSRFSDDTGCICSTQTVPIGEVNCCGINKTWDNNDICTCNNTVASSLDSITWTSSLNCCNVSTSYEDYTQCQCFVNFNATKCCGYNPFKTTNQECICANQDQPDTPDDCCDYAPFKGNNQWCTCQSQTANGGSALNPTFCCNSTATINATHECKCHYQPLDSPQLDDGSTCCDTDRFNNTDVCKCLKQTDSIGPIDCCPYRPGDVECGCRNLTTNISEPGYGSQHLNCCTLNKTTNYFTSKTECECYSDFDAQTCCGYDAFQSYPECKCLYNINGTYPSDCCDQSPWNSITNPDHGCVCKAQGSSNPISPEYCCDIYPDTLQCKCDAQPASNPILSNGTSCCDVDVEKFNLSSLCYCSKIAEPGYDQGCCQLSPYNETEDCQCNFFQTSANESDSDGYNCCGYTRFHSVQPCLCADNDTWSADLCCNYTAFGSDPRCPYIATNCDQLYLLTGAYNSSCCADPAYIFLPICCQYHNFGFNLPLWNCCPYSPFNTTDHTCICHAQGTGLGKTDCCDITPYSTSYECQCNTSSVGINYTAPVLNCCNSTGGKGNTKECKCEFAYQNNRSLLSPDACCELPRWNSTPECACAAQKNATSPNDCCWSDSWNKDPYCQCRTQQNTSLLTPIDCCAYTDWMNQPECKCAAQIDPLTPNDCCSSETWKGTDLCSCRNNFTLGSKCCAIYPNNPGCKCLTDFVIPACCAYNSTHDGCEAVTQECYPNDTALIDPYYETTENYYDEENTIYILEGLIYLNPLLRSNHTTFAILANTQDVFQQVPTSALTDNGLSNFQSEPFAFTTELPWEGTFSVNVLLTNNLTQGNGQNVIFSTNTFTVTVALSDDGSSASYVVLDEQINQVTEVVVDIETPDAGWWTQLQNKNRTYFFGNYTPQKVELAFSGRDCWLTVVSINNVHATSDVWSCLAPTSEQLSNISIENDVEIRRHFGAFNLGSSPADITTTTNNAISLSYVYMVAGKIETLGILPAEIVVGDSENAPANTDGLCDVAFDWNKITIVDGQIDCNPYPASDYGNFSSVTFTHAFRYVPPYQYCGSVYQPTDDNVIKSHLCDQQASYVNNSLEISSGQVSEPLILQDLIVLSSSFEDYNPTVVFDKNGNPSIYLVADNEAGLRTVSSPIFDEAISGIDSVSFGVTFSVTSFPYKILNADHGDPTAELVYNLRLFGQKTISVVFFVQRSAAGGFKIARLFQGALKEVSGNITVNTTNTITYSGEVSFDWTTQDFSVSDSITSDAVGATAQTWSGSYTDEGSAEIEVSFQTFFSAGPTHGYFKSTEFITDRSAVFKISDFSLSFNTTQIFL